MASLIGHVGEFNDLMTTQRTFEEFIVDARTQLRRAYAGHMPPDAVADAVAEAEAYAWEHRRHLARLANPIGYLYRVGQSRTRSRKQGFIRWEGDVGMPDIEPGLPDAMAKLPPKQAAAVWLVKACGWTNIQAAEALDVSPSTVATHVSRGMDRLRRQLGVDDA